MPVFLPVDTVMGFAKDKEGNGSWNTKYTYIHTYIHLLHTYIHTYIHTYTYNITVSHLCKVQTYVIHTYIYTYILTYIVIFIVIFHIQNRLCRWDNHDWKFFCSFGEWSQGIWNERVRQSIQRRRAERCHTYYAAFFATRNRIVFGAVALLSASSSCVCIFI